VLAGLSISSDRKHKLIAALLAMTANRKMSRKKPELQTGYGRLGFINCKLSHILEFDEPRKTVNLTVYIDEGRSSYPRSTFGSAVFSAASRVCP